MRQLYGVLNTAAHLIVSKWKFDSTSSTIRDVLHRLPIQQRIQYKLCTLVFSCLHGVAPVYLSTMYKPVNENLGHRCLRSAARGDLAVTYQYIHIYSAWNMALILPSHSTDTNTADTQWYWTQTCYRMSQLWRHWTVAPSADNSSLPAAVTLELHKNKTTNIPVLMSWIMKINVLKMLAKCLRNH